MTTIVLDSDYSDELLHINEDPLFEYGSPFVMDDLYGTAQQQLKKNFEDNNNRSITTATRFESCRASDCSSEEDYDFTQQLHHQPHAPPPSPQDTCMLDMFSQKLTSSLEACLRTQQEKEKEEVEEEVEEEEEMYINTFKSSNEDTPPQFIDKLLRRSLSAAQNNNSGSRGVCKRNKSHKRSLSSTATTTTSSIWQQRAKNQKLNSIAKATEQAEKLRLALQKHLMDEETKIMINELKDMGL